MRSKKVTLKMIAEQLGMTPATISKALRDSTDISEETKRRVKEVADNLGYHPNLMARSLVQRRSYLLGVMVPDLRISFFSEAVRGIYERAREKGYEAIIVVNDEDLENEERNLKFLAALPVDGILINAVPATTNCRLMQRMRDQGIPFVSWDRTIDGFDTSSVTIDDEAAAFEVMEYFVKNGRRDILFLGPTDHPSVVRGRYNGFCKGRNLFGIPERADRVATCKIDYEAARDTMQRVLESGIRPDAVLCVGGLIAHGAGRAILDAGLRIPQDILLAEFGDNDVVARLGVPFVTIHQFPLEIGRRAVDILLEEIDLKPRPHAYHHEIIPAKLLERTLG
ncbi:LacI family DNA-binding transcriptional regulator [bacterium]|nr:LacI family DNA-binding transcriptional regulator [bacterium]